MMRISRRSAGTAILSVGTAAVLAASLLSGACNPGVSKRKVRDYEAGAGGESPSRAGAAGAQEVPNGGDAPAAPEPTTGGTGVGGSGGAGTASSGSSSGGTGTAGTLAAAGQGGTGGVAPGAKSAGCGKLPTDADPDFTLPPGYDPNNAYPVVLGCADGTPDTVCMASCDALDHVRDAACVTLDPVVGCT